MRMNTKDYETYANSFAPKSKIFSNCIKAFLIGGAICVLGEALLTWYGNLGLDKEQSATLECITLIFLASLLTALHWFDNIAKHAGAGTVVPITGFSNAVTSAAMEFKSEGMVLGVGAKIFTIAGPVITYGVIASMVAGIYYFVLSIL